MKDNLNQKTAARFLAVQAIFQMENRAQTLENVSNEFINYRFAENPEDSQRIKADKRLFRKILQTLITYQRDIDRSIYAVLKVSWKLEKIDPTLRAIFRACGAESFIKKDAPNMLISEYIKIARMFYSDSKEMGFANAVLDNLLAALHSEKSLGSE